MRQTGDRQTVRSTFFLLVPVALFVSLHTADAGAQWIQFSDDTGSRLSLTTVTMDDAEEKDVAVADLDHDGWDDLVVVRKVPFSEAGARTDILLMNEGGILTERTATFAPEFLTVPTDARDVFILDFTGDGWEDVVIANTFSQQPQFYRNLGTDAGGDWLGLANESAARFPYLTPENLPDGPLFCAVWAGDVSGDLAPDLYFANYLPKDGTTDVLLINDGAGFFTDETGPRLGDYADVAFGSGAVIADMNDDGFNDIVKMSTNFPLPTWDGFGLYILFNDGTGVFDTHPFQRVDDPVPYMMLVEDFNGDTVPDIYVVSDNQDQVATAMLTNPASVIYDYASPSPSPRTATFGGNLRAVDIDNDQDMDLAISPVDVSIENCNGVFAGELAILRNDGGIFSDPFPVDESFHLRPHDIEFLDIDGNGCQDMFLALCTGWKVFMQSGCDVSSSESALHLVPELRASPNPFSSFTAVELGSLSNQEADRFRLSIYDATGRMVRSLLDDDGDPGRRDLIVWDGTDQAGRKVAADVYFLRAEAGDRSREIKVTKLR